MHCLGTEYNERCLQVSIACLPQLKHHNELSLKTEASQTERWLHCTAVATRAEETGVAQKALDMLAGIRVLGCTEHEAIIQVNTKLTAIGELSSTSRDTAVASGSVSCSKGQVLALQASPLCP